MTLAVPSRHFNNLRPTERMRRRADSRCTKYLLPSPHLSRGPPPRRATILRVPNSFRVQMSVQSEGSRLRALIASSVFFLATTLLLFLNLFMSSNAGLVQLGPNWLLAPLGLVVFYVSAWLGIHRQRPERDPIVVQYKTPESITPAQARYLYTLDCDGRAFVACILNLAAHGSLAIGPEPDAVYLSASLKEPAAVVPAEDACVFHALFPSNQIARLKPPSQALQSQLARILRQKTSAAFNGRPATLLVGLAAMVVVSLWMAWNSGMLMRVDGRLDLTPAVLLAGSLGFAGLTGFAYWQHNRRAVLLAWRGIYPYRTVPLLLLPLLIIPLFFWLFLRAVAPTFAAVTVLLLLLNVFASPFLMGYTAHGARLLRQLLGFRQFLLSTEQDRLNRLAIRDSVSSADLSLLAYAVALDVPTIWADRLGLEVMTETSILH
jgi:hypothetical protein